MKTALSLGLVSLFAHFNYFFDLLIPSQIWIIDHMG